MHDDNPYRSPQGPREQPLQSVDEVTPRVPKKVPISLRIASAICLTFGLLLITALISSVGTDELRTREWVVLGTINFGLFAFAYWLQRPWPWY